MHCRRKPKRPEPIGLRGIKPDGNWVHVLADIPARGARFQPGYPVCTVMAEFGLFGTVIELERVLEELKDGVVRKLVEGG